MISATVSLGYDVPRGRVEELLLEAARAVESQDPFVQVQHLGDFSVTYRVAGLPSEVKQLLSARSRLRAKVMDQLHMGGIEIVSPSFMNTRSVAADRQFIPATVSAAEESVAPEVLVVDNAEEAESKESEEKP